MHYLPAFDCDIPDIDLLSLVFDSSLAWAKDDTIIYAEAADDTNYLTKAGATTWIKRLAYILRHQFGVGASQDEPAVVTCISSNQVMLPIVFYAVIAAGGIYSAASTALTTPELTRQVEQGQSSLIIASEETAQTAVEAARRCKLPQDRVLILDSKNHARILKPALPTRTINYLTETQELPWERITDRPVLERKTVALLFSSGTTGVPKGVQLSHRNFVSEAIITQAAIGAFLARTNRQVHVNFTYRTLAHLPAAHISGLQGYFINGIMAGGTVFWMPRFVFEEFVVAAKKYAITFILSVPAVFLRIAKSDTVTDEFHSLLHAQSGAAPMGPELQTLAKAKLK